MRLISLGLVPIFLNLMARYALAAMDRQRVYLSAVLVGLGVNVGAGLAFIPARGSEGAALAFVCAELVIAVLCQRAFREHVGFGDLLAAARKPAIAAAVMGGVLVALGRAPLGVVIAAGILAYAAVLAVLRVFAADELLVLRNLLRSLPTEPAPARAGAAASEVKS